MAAPMRISAGISCKRILRQCFKSQAKLEGRVPCFCAFYSTEEAAPIIHEGSKLPRLNQKAEKISKAMKAYLERAKVHDQILERETAEFELGRRHLANIMGEDPETFGREQVDRAISYLLPSGLFDKKARPMMKHPSEILPKYPAAAFGMEGRPHHYMFYTGFPEFYDLLHNMAVKLEALIAKEEKMNVKMQWQPAVLDLLNTEWINRQELSQQLMEDITEKMYFRFKLLGDALCEHPLSSLEKEYIMSLRRQILVDNVIKLADKEVLEDEEGKTFQMAIGKRKTAVAEVKLWPKGTGKFSINDEDIMYFKDILYREQVMFPLQFTGLLGEVDIIATVSGGGVSSQAGAVRLGISICCASFVDEEMLDKMNMAGLLTRDPRMKERKKPGQKGARAKFTWVKR